MDEPERSLRRERCDKMIQFVKNDLSSISSSLTAEELEAVRVAIERRLYSMAKCGVQEIKDVFSLPTSAFHTQYQPEASLLQSAGDKLCRFSLNY
jgi:hypothetical protein